jgi:gamma-glutamylcyclotransferase (GGCT)/AIG2-like uncharacterized protein YtfP
MRIFVYGTLLDPLTLARRAGTPGLGRRLAPALLAGYRRTGLRLSRYPTLRRDPAHVTDGAVVDIPAAALRRLAAYEGPRYRLCRRMAGTPAGPRPAWLWIAAGATRAPWPAGA